MQSGIEKSPGYFPLVNFKANNITPGRLSNWSFAYFSIVKIKQINKISEILFSYLCFSTAYNITYTNKRFLMLH